MTPFATYQIASGLIMATGSAPHDDGALLQNHGDTTLAVDLNPPADVEADGRWRRAADGTYAQDALPAPTLDDLKATAQAALDTKYATASAVWYGHSAAGVQMDDGSRSVMTAAVTMVELAQAAGAFTSFRWKMADNSVETFSTSTAFLTFALTAGAWWQSVFWNYQTIKSAIATAPNAATLGAIDINGGWPP